MNKSIYILASASLLLIGCSHQETSTSLESSFASEESSLLSSSEFSTSPSSSSISMSLPTGEPTSPSEVDHIVYRLPKVFSTPDYTLETDFVEADFHNDPTLYSASTASFAFACNCNENEGKGKEFFAQAHFENVVFYLANEIGESSYCFAMREMDGFYLCNVTIVGFMYWIEWSENFHLGASGDHAGFSLMADYVKAKLIDYLSPYASMPVKLFINGYSRGGAVSSLLSKRFHEEPLQGINPNDIYTYIFEAPVCGGEDLELDYIHEIYSEKDPIVNIVPDSYGLYHIGTPHQIQDDDHYLDYMNAYFPAETTSAYVPSEAYPTSLDLLAAIKAILSDPFPIEAHYSLETRADYVANIEPALRACLLVLASNGLDYLGENFDLIKETLPLMLGAVSSEANCAAAFRLLFTRLNLPYTEDQISVIASGLHPLLSKMLVYRKEAIASMIDGIKENGDYLIKQHFPMTVYAFLMHYN